MKATIYLFAMAMLFVLQSCMNDCPPEPLNNDDLAAYIDGSTGILFTTPEDKEDVLSSLDATLHERDIYKMPVINYDNKEVYMLFTVSEVSTPAAYTNFRIPEPLTDPFKDFENELIDILERNKPNVADAFVTTCGDFVGKLGEMEENKVKNGKGNLKEKTKKLQEKKEAKDKIRDELIETAKEKGIEAKQKLDNADKEGAKEKAKELKEKVEEKYDEYYDYDFGYKWKQKWGLKLYYYPPDPKPDLFIDTVKNNIKIKVYRNAECGGKPPIYTFECQKMAPMFPLNPDEAIWVTRKQDQYTTCKRGKGYCVEQEVVVAIEYIYTDPACKFMIDVNPEKKFACIK